MIKEMMYEEKSVVGGKKLTWSSKMIQIAALYNI